MEELVEFEIIVTDVIFDPGTVSVLSQPIRLELTGLQLTSEIIHLALQSVPAGLYTSVTVMLLDPKIRFCPDPPASCTDQNVLNIVLAVNPSKSTSTINFGVTSGQVTALLLDFDLRAMVVTDTMNPGFPFRLPLMARLYTRSPPIAQKLRSSHNRSASKAFI